MENHRHQHRQPHRHRSRQQPKTEMLTPSTKGSSSSASASSSVSSTSASASPSPRMARRSSYGSGNSNGSQHADQLGIGYFPVYSGESQPEETQYPPSMQVEAQRLAQLVAANDNGGYAEDPRGVGRSDRGNHDYNLAATSNRGGSARNSGGLAVEYAGQDNANGGEILDFDDQSAAEVGFDDEISHDPQHADESAFGMPTSPGGANSNTISPFSARASKCIEMHDYEQAIVYLQKALEEYYSAAAQEQAGSQKQLLHVDHPFGHLANVVQACNAAATSFNLGALCKKTRRYEEAIDYLYQAESLYRHCKSLLVGYRQQEEHTHGPPTVVCLDQLIIETLHMCAQLHLKYRGDLENAIECHQQVVKLLLPLEGLDRELPTCRYEHIVFLSLDEDDPRRQGWLAISWEQLGKCHYQQVMALPASKAMLFDDSYERDGASTPPPKEYQQMLQNSTDAFEQAAVSIRWMLDHAADEESADAHRQSLVSVLQQISKMSVLISSAGAHVDKEHSGEAAEQYSVTKQHHLDRSADALHEAVDLVFAHDSSTIESAANGTELSVTPPRTGFVPISSQPHMCGLDSNAARVTPEPQNSGLLGEDLVDNSRPSLPRSSPEAKQLLHNLVQLGAMYEDAQQWDQAVQIYERVLLVQSNYHGSTHPIVAQSLVRVGRVLTYQGNPDGGLDLFEAAHDIYHHRLQRVQDGDELTEEELEELPKVILAHLTLVQSMAQLYIAMRQSEDAVVCLTECLDEMVSERATYLECVQQNMSIDVDRLAVTFDRHIARMYRELGRAYVDQSHFIEANHCLISSVRILDRIAERHDDDCSDDEEQFEDVDRMQARALMQRIELLQRMDPAEPIARGHSTTSDDADEDEDNDEKKIDPPDTSFGQILPTTLSAIYSEEENEMELELIYNRQRKSMPGDGDSSAGSDDTDLDVTHPTFDSTSGLIGLGEIDEQKTPSSPEKKEAVQPLKSPKDETQRTLRVSSFPNLRDLPSPLNAGEFSMGGISRALSHEFEASVVSDDALSSNYFRPEKSSGPPAVLGGFVSTSGDDSTTGVTEFASAFPFSAMQSNKPKSKSSTSEDAPKTSLNVSQFLYNDTDEAESDELPEVTVPLHRSEDAAAPENIIPDSSSFQPNRSSRSPSDTPSPDLSESSRTGLLQSGIAPISVSTPKVLRMPHLSSPRHPTKKEKKDKDFDSAKSASRNRFVKAISSPFRRVKKNRVFTVNSFDEEDIENPPASPAPISGTSSATKVLRASPDSSRSAKSPAVFTLSSSVPEREPEPQQSAPSATPSSVPSKPIPCEFAQAVPPPPPPPKPAAPVDLVATQCDDSVSQLTLPVEENRFLPRASSEKQKEGQWWWGVNTEGLEGWFPSSYVNQAVEAAGGFLKGKVVQDNAQTKPLEVESEDEADLDNNTLLGLDLQKDVSYSKPLPLVPMIAEDLSPRAEAQEQANAYVKDDNHLSSPSVSSETDESVEGEAIEQMLTSKASVEESMVSHESSLRKPDVLDLTSKSKQGSDDHEVQSQQNTSDVGTRDGSVESILTQATLHMRAKNVVAATESLKQALEVQLSRNELQDAAVTAQRIAELHLQQKQFQKALDMYTEAQSLLERHYGYSHEDVAKILNKCGDFLAQQGKFDVAMEKHQEALQILRRRFGEEVKHPLVSQTLIQIGAVYYRERNSLSTIQSRVDGYSTFIEGGMLEIIGRAHEDRGSYRMAIAFFEEKLQFLDDSDESDDLEHVSETLNSLGMLSCRAGLYMEAIDYYDKALGIQMKLGCHDVQLAMARVLTGSVQLYLGLFPKSLKLFQDALVILRKEVGEEHETVAATVYQIGVVRACMCEFDSAMTSLHEALTMQKSILGNEHPATLRTRREIGNMYTLYVSELPAAFEEFESILQAQKRIHGEKHPNVAETLHSIGCAHARKEDFDQALKYFENCYNMRLKFLGMDHPLQATTLHEIGKIHLKNGALNKALHICDAALKIRMESLSEQHVDVAVSMATKASCLVASGNFTEAARLFDEALPMAEEAVGRNHPTMANILVQIGIMHQRKCHFDEARDAIEQALEIYQTANLDDDYPGIKEAHENLTSIERAEMLCV